MIRRVFTAAVLGVVCAVLGGCSPGDPTMVEVTNQTNRPVRVELFTLEPTGEKRNYSTVLLTEGGLFSFGTEPEDRLAGMRARFTLQSDIAGPEAFNAVTLNIPERGVRSFDLRLINERLVARELPQGHKADPTKER